MIGGNRFFIKIAFLRLSTGVPCKAATAVPHKLNCFMRDLKVQKPKILAAVEFVFRQFMPKFFLFKASLNISLNNCK